MQLGGGEGQGEDEGDRELQHGEDCGSLRRWRAHRQRTQAAGHHQVQLFLIYLYLFCNLSTVMC